MAHLPFDQQVDVIAHIVSGTSIRKTEFITKVHRDTIMRLCGRAGAGCALIHDTFFHNLITHRLELDEIWSFVGKKQRRLTPYDPSSFGDQYTYVALDVASRAAVGYRIGKRTSENTQAFLLDLKRRLAVVPTISSDSFQSYEDAVRQAFGKGVHYGQLIKIFKGAEMPSHGEESTPPRTIAAIRKVAMIGFPDLAKVSTSYVERQNLTMRMEMRRLTRRSSGFSKKLENHVAAMHLHFAHYNFCRVHETIKTAPARELGLIDRPWALHQLVYTALKNSPTQ